MRNKRMAEKLASGEAIDISARILDNGEYLLPEFIEGKDYCDTNTEKWIWSIGRPLKKMAIQASPKMVLIVGPDQYLASTDTKYYLNPDFECVWLR